MALERNDQLVRCLEAELLDRNHLQFVIFRRGQQTAISHLLKVLGDFLRELESKEIDCPWSTLQTIGMTVVEAVEHALRWVLLECKGGTHQPGVDWEQKDAEASDLLAWAVHYAQLYLDHTAWSRGMMSPLVDLEFKTITFDYPLGNTGVLLDQLESDHRNPDILEDSIPQSIHETIVRPWLSALREDNLHELPVVTIDRECVAYQDAIKWAERMILPEISYDRNLGGFTLGEFRQFYISLLINCRCCVQFEDAIDRALGQENFLGTRPLQNLKENIIDWLAQSCAIPIRTMRNIVELLTFDATHRHPSFVGHLFMPSVDGALTLLPRLFVRTEPNLMLSVALNTGGTRRIYDSLIEEIETSAKKQLATFFREYGYAVWDSPSLERLGMDPLTPDLVVGREDDEMIAVIEYKHALPPRGAAAVCDRIKEASKWIMKANRYLITSKTQTQRLQINLGISAKARQVVVVIAPKWPMPALINVYAEGVYIKDVSHIKREVCRKANIAEIVGIKSMVSQPLMKRGYHDIQVGEWTYRHPILVPI